MGNNTTSNLHDQGREPTFHVERDRVPAEKFGTLAPKRLRGFYGPEPKLHGSFTGMTFSLHIN